MGRLPFRAILTAAALCGASAAGAQAAGSALTTMPVSVTLMPGCSVSAAPLAFGAVAIDRAAAHAADAGIDVRCAGEVPFTVQLDGGRSPGGGTRNAADPATGRAVAYDIFVDPAHTRRWGSADREMVASSTDASGVARLTAYGLILDDGRTAAGDYADLVTVTISF